MKISEIIEELRKYAPDTEIIISRDSEGNGFSPIDEIASVLYSPVEDGYVYSLKDKEEAGEYAINALVLYPLDNYGLRQWQRAQQAR